MSNVCGIGILWMTRCRVGSRQAHVRGGRRSGRHGSRMKSHSRRWRKAGGTRRDSCAGFRAVQVAAQPRHRNFRRVAFFTGSLTAIHHAGHRAFAFTLARVDAGHRTAKHGDNKDKSCEPLCHH